MFGKLGGGIAQLVYEGLLRQSWFTAVPWYTGQAIHRGAILYIGSVIG
ncbi:MAG: hypothetical protein ACSHYC_21785 [Alphaproteobacteria bacterium]